MLDKIKNLNVVLVLLIILSLNSIRDINIAQAMVAVGIFGLMGYIKYLKHIEKPDFSATIMAELEHVKSQMTGISLRNTKQSSAPISDGKRFF